MGQQYGHRIYKIPPDSSPVCKETTIIVMDNIEPTVLTIIGIIYLIYFVECLRYVGEKRKNIALTFGSTLSDLS